MRVLVIEDEEHTQDALREALERRGCEVIVASCLDEMYAAMRNARERKNPFDVIVSDFHLYEKNGALRTSRAPAKWSKDSKFAVIYFSALSPAEMAMESARDTDFLAAVDSPHFIAVQKDKIGDHLPPLNIDEVVRLVMNSTRGYAL